MNGPAAIEALERADRLSLLPAPSPLHPLAGLHGRYGLPLWIKRDDLTGVGLGGNKTRKLEYLLADAKAKGARAVVTGGGIQSNHSSATAILARRFGLACHLALAESVPISGPHYDEGGNVAVDRLCGATIRRYPAAPDTNELIADLADRVEADSGQRPYVIPVGGSNTIGARGFVRAGLELAEQLERVDAAVGTIVLASGSGGTQAGLVVGLSMAGLPTRVIGVSVARREKSLRPIVGSLCDRVATELGLDGVDWDERIEIDDRFIGQGYGVPSPGTWSAIESLIETDAVVTDPVYTGKAVEGLLHRLDRERSSLDGGCLFWHTGGVSGLLAYAGSIAERAATGS